MQELLHAHSAAFPLELTVQLDPRHPQVLLVQLGISVLGTPWISKSAQLENFHCQGPLFARNATLPLAVSAQLDPRHPQVLFVQLGITAWVVPTISSLAQLEIFHCQGLLPARNATLPLAVTAQRDPRHPQVLLVPLDITAWVVPTISSLAQSASSPYQGLPHVRNATLLLAVTAPRDHLQQKVLRVPLDITAWVVRTISSLAHSASSQYQGLLHVRNATLPLAIFAQRDHLQQKVLPAPLDISAREELMTRNFAKLLLVTSAPQDQCRQPESPVLSSTIVRAVQMTSNLVVPQQALFVLPGHHRPQA